MKSAYTPLEFHLLNDFQRGFPLVPAPFAALADELGCDEATVLTSLRGLGAQGVVSRVGAVLSPRRIGASTLAALAAPPARLEEIAELVSARPEVNHNYEREHRYNLWFVATAASETALAHALAAIEQETGCKVISLPMIEEFHIDLGFDLSGGHKTKTDGIAASSRPLAPAERRLIAALQEGLEFVPHPFARLAAKAGMDEGEAIASIHAWLDEGVIKRFGVIVRHHELGYTANAMVVFDVPDAEVGAIGSRLAREPGVTLCYRRRRHAPDWSFNLFCMVHGRSRAAVAPVVARLALLAGRPCEVLFSTRRFKQCGARYFDALDAAA